jgi:hypothetical protein
MSYDAYWLSTVCHRIAEYKMWRCGVLLTVKGEEMITVYRYLPITMRDRSTVFISDHIKIYLSGLWSEFGLD